jgi:hypothetical protein
MKITERVREAVRNFLRIEQPSGVSFAVRQLLDFEAEVFKYRIWWRGESSELEDLYSQIDGSGRRSFWGARTTGQTTLRKLHSGLPGMIISVLTDVCTDDLYSVNVAAQQPRWDAIADANGFPSLIKSAVEQVLALGDGAFKLSYDPAFPEPLVLEFYPADKVDFEYSRGRLQEVVFKTIKRVGEQDCTLSEHYSTQGVFYSATNAYGQEIDLATVPDFAGLEERQFKKPFMAAVPVMFNRSRKHPGRGEPLLTSKLDSLEALDEIISQWMLALRRGQLKTYIPEEFIPRSTEKGREGELIPLSEFDSDFIKTSVDPGMLGNGNAALKIEHTQGLIPSQALLEAYITTLDLCLQGIISPSTLGIDMKKLDNAEAQREKEKTTLYTRNKVLDALEGIIPQLVRAVLAFDAEMRGAAPPSPDMDVDVQFGGYANPSFEAQVETVAKARTGGIMSMEAAVEELYGDTKDDEWKAEEVRRLKEESGLTEAPEPAVNLDGEVNDNGETS